MGTMGITYTFHCRLALGQKEKLRRTYGDNHSFAVFLFQIHLMLIMVELMQ